MALVFEWLQIRMNLERAEVAAERLVLVASNFLIAKEQHLMLNERGSHLVERALAEFSKMNATNFCAQCSGNRTYRYMLPSLHRDFSSANIQDATRSRLVLVQVHPSEDPNIRSLAAIPAEHTLFGGEIGQCRFEFRLRKSSRRSL
jgi:hypothetical protein